MRRTGWAGALAASTVAATLLLAACGSAQKPDFSADVPAGAARIDQDALRFKPDELTVETGEPVYFTNSETAVHNVTLEGEDLSGTLQRGDVFIYTFDEPGEYELTCTFHPQMRTTITVQ